MPDLSMVAALTRLADSKARLLALEAERTDGEALKSRLLARSRIESLRSGWTDATLWTGVTMVGSAIGRAERGNRRSPSPTALRHIAEAERVLYGNAPGLSGEDALAERERLRRLDVPAPAPQLALPLERAR